MRSCCAGMDDFDLAALSARRADFVPARLAAAAGQARAPTSRCLQSQALDAFGTRFAICNTLYGGHAVRQRHHGRGDVRRDERLDREGMAGARRAAARLDRGAGAGARSFAVSEIERKAGDQRFVQILLPAAAEMMLRQAATTGRSTRSPQHYDLPVGLHAGSMYRHAPTAERLAVALSAGLCQPVAGVRGPVAQPGLRRRVRQVSETARGADRIRRHLAAALPVARDQDLARRARRGAVGEALAGGVYPRPRAA